MFDGRPAIGICNTWSEVTPCNAHFREIAELEKRRKEWKAPAPHDVRGYVKLYCDHVDQADQRVDLDFLVGKSGAPVARESH